MDNIEDWMDFGIGDSMDGAGRSPESYQKRPLSEGGILHIIYPRHQVSTCAHCGRRISEIDAMYTRDGRSMFCDPSHEKAHRKNGGA